MDWLKFYTEARKDRKILSLPIAERWVWVALLCFAAEQPERGVITGYDNDLLAVEVADGDAELLESTLNHLCKLRILGRDDDGCITFLKFKARQSRKPSDAPTAAALRKQQQRERERQAKGVTDTSGANVTPLSRPVTRDTENVTPPDKEKEEELTPSSEGVSATAATPGTSQDSIPPQVREEWALIAYLLEKAATLFHRNKLIPAAEGTIRKWFAEHKRKLTREIIDRAIEAAATYTEGESLGYFLTVMQNEMADPARGKPAGSNNKGHITQGPDLKGKYPPNRQFAFEKNDKGEWLQITKRNPRTRMFAYGCTDLAEAQFQNDTKWDEHEAAASLGAA